MRVQILDHLLLCYGKLKYHFYKLKCTFTQQLIESKNYYNQQYNAANSLESELKKDQGITLCICFPI